MKGRLEIERHQKLAGDLGKINSCISCLKREIEDTHGIESEEWGQAEDADYADYAVYHLRSALSCRSFLEHPDCGRQWRHTYLYFPLPGEIGATWTPPRPSGRSLAPTAPRRWHILRRMEKPNRPDGMAEAA